MNGSVTADMAHEPSRALAAFVSAIRPQDVPASVRADARRSLLNWFGVAIGGARHEAVEAAIGAFAVAGTAGPARLVGRRERLGAMNATTVNGLASAVLDFDSTQHKKTNIHPSGPVAPALLALADLRPVSGSDFLHAYILGTEIACRIANSVFGKANPGWHVTGVCGGAGAAAGAARLLGLDAQATLAALGIAATQGAGLREMYGTMCKALTPGRSGENGLLAALLAQRGFTSAQRPLEGGKGLAAVFAGVDDLSDLAAGLGEAYEVSFNTHKPYPCAIVTHAVIDGAATLAARHGFAPGDIESAELFVSAIAVELAGKAEPRDGLESKFSLHHAAAIGFAHGGARVEHFTEAAVNDPALRSLRRRISVGDVRPYAKSEAMIAVRLSGGARHEIHVPHALGSPDNPMDDGDVAEKFMALAEPVLGRDQAEQLRDGILAIEGAPAMDALTALACPADGPPSCSGPI